MIGMSALPVYFHGVMHAEGNADTFVTPNVASYGLHLNDRNKVLELLGAGGEEVILCLIFVSCNKILFLLCVIIAGCKLCGFLFLFCFCLFLTTVFLYCCMQTLQVDQPKQVPF